MQYDFTAPAIMATYSKQSKNLKMAKATNQIEKDAIELGIKYELIPPRPDGLDKSVKNWAGIYKQTNPDAITLEELEKIVSKEKLHKFIEKRKKVKEQHLTSDNKSEIEKKILDNDPRFDKKDGIFYWKGTNIKVDPKTVE
jgi:hypothetical protein